MLGQKFTKDSIVAFFFSHLIGYPTPSNLNFLWSFGSISGLVLVIQMISGIFLSMHYTPHIALAFSSIEFVMRQVEFGWFFRNTRANGASIFFGAIYLHLARGIFYRSYSYPRGSLRVSGVVIFILVMATSFLGSVLPWGQMSF
jgi:ubiquinol-cytochrome c reductase cytochrome b subunit